jgi:hypothetical protein
LRTVCARIGVGKQSIFTMSADTSLVSYQGAFLSNSPRSSRSIANTSKTASPYLICQRNSTPWPKTNRDERVPRALDGGCSSRMIFETIVNSTPRIRDLVKKDSNSTSRTLRQVSAGTSKLRSASRLSYTASTVARSYSKRFGGFSFELCQPPGSADIGRFRAKAPRQCTRIPLAMAVS